MCEGASTDSAASPCRAHALGLGALRVPRALRAASSARQTRGRPPHSRGFAAPRTRPRVARCARLLWSTSSGRSPLSLSITSSGPVPSAPCPLTYRPPGRLARLQGLLNSRSRGSGPTAPPTHHNRELNPARPLCDPAWRRRFHTQIRPSWRTQAARLVEAARRAGVPQARSGPHCCGRCARRSHDHRLSHPRSRASSHCRCWRPGPAAQRGGAGASLALRGA